MAKLAFYKGKGDITDRLIRWWTNSKYSHVELVIDDMWYSTSPRDLSVRAKKIVVKPEHWDFVDVEIDRLSVEAFYASTKGAKYDWLGIVLSVGLLYKTSTEVHSKQRWFCSEWVATALKFKNASKYAPGDLYKRVINAPN